MWGGGAVSVLTFWDVGGSWAVEVSGGHSQLVQEHQVEPGLPPGHPSSMDMSRWLARVVQELKVRPQEQSGEVWMPRGG